MGPVLTNDVLQELYVTQQVIAKPGRATYFVLLNATDNPFTDANMSLTFIGTTVCHIHSKYKNATDNNTSRLAVLENVYNKMDSG